MKKNIMFIILGIVLCAGIWVFADDILEATGIRYKTKTVQDSLNELYIKANAKNLGAQQICKLTDTTYGSFGEIGSMYECEVGNNIKYNFYLLAKNNNNTVDMIMDRNITDTIGDSRTISWESGIIFFRSGIGKTEADKWINVLKVGLPNVQSIADTHPSNTWLYGYDSMSWLCLGTHAKDLNNWPYCNTATNQSYAWLFNHLNQCTSGGCTDDSSATTNGYWTSDFGNTQHGYYVYHTGLISRNLADNEAYGIRPVITVLKTNLYTE